MKVHTDLGGNPGWDFQTLMKISQITTSSALRKEALDQFVPLARKMLLFDNFVIYQSVNEKNVAEGIYARSMGRGKNQGDSLNWGDTIAPEVFKKNRIILKGSSSTQTKLDRIDQPYIIGIPLKVTNHPPAALILIRYGGPAFDVEDKPAAQFLADQASLILLHDQKSSQKSTSEEDLINLVAHELLTPIGFIKGYVTTLMRPGIQLSDETRNEFLTIIDEEADHLQDLVKDILDSSRLQEGTLAMVNQPVLLDGLINDTLLHLKQFFPDLQVVFTKSDTIPSLNGDPRRLQQVIENLVTNAIKYAPDSPVYIHLETMGRELHLTIRDEGPGMSADVSAHLFEKYYRGPVSKNVHGSGLGLFICQKIVQAHNGDIMISSAPGVGTTVTVILPCS